MDPLRENAIFRERFVKVVCVGAGAAGICLAYKLKRSFTNYSLTIYEKNPDIAGTWYENRYPGCACDVPAHNYTFSFEPKADWSSVYAGPKEISGYFKGFVAKYGLEKFIRTSHVVSKAQWNESEGKWHVEITSLATGETVHDWCHILVHATGYLNKPAWPRVPGLETYKGVKIHSADYDEGLSLEGKDVILIGGASSAVQILPAIQPVVKRVKNFIRTPAWMLPDISTSSAKYTPQEIRRFVESPEAVMRLRQENERTMNSIFTMYMKGTVLQEQCKELLVGLNKKILGDGEMARQLTPKFSVGCKRVIPSGARYLETLQKPNVKAVFSGVASFTETGCVDEQGDLHTADVIICATGFDTSYIPRYPILLPGRDSSRPPRNLQEEWAAPDSITAYMGVGIASYPNTFTLLGPYTPVSNGPMLVAIEAQADYICGFVDRFQTEPAIHSMAPNAAACAEFKAQVAGMMQGLVWTDGCRNSHNNHAVGARVPTTWPGSTLHYLEAVREARPQDWDFVYDSEAGNRFAWLGDGVSQVEWEPTVDLAYYIRDTDDGVFGSRRARTLALAKAGSMPPRALHRQAKLAVAAVATGGEENAVGGAAASTGGVAESDDDDVAATKAATAAQKVPGPRTAEKAASFSGGLLSRLRRRLLLS